MDVPVWVPIAVALTALAGVVYQSRAGQRAAKDELATNTLLGIIAAMEKDRQYLRNALNDCLDREGARPRSRRKAREA